MVEQNLKEQYEFLKELHNGFEEHSISEIESGLIQAHKLFIEYVLENKRDDLVALGRDLDSIYFPFRLKDNSPSNKEISYLGQLRALVNLCDYVTRLRIPQQVWKNIRKSKYVEPILQSLLANGSMLAIDLSNAIGLPHTSQLSRIVRPLISEGVLILEEIGRYNWYSLTATGRLIASERAESGFFVEPEKIVSGIMSELKEGWKSELELTEKINADMPISTRNSLVDIVLLTLKEAGVVKELGGKWKITANLMKNNDIWLNVGISKGSTKTEQGFEEILPILKSLSPGIDFTGEEFYKSWHVKNIDNIEQKSEEEIKGQFKNRMTMRNPKWQIKI